MRYQIFFTKIMSHAFYFNKIHKKNENKIYCNDRNELRTNNSVAKKKTTEN